MKKNIIFTIILFFIMILSGFYYRNYFKKTGTKNNESIAKENTQIQIMNNDLKMQIIKEGTGERIKNGQRAIVHYIGTLENGIKFDSSRDRGEPFVFTLGAGQVIKGWDFGVVGMKVGEIRKLTISPKLAYGETGVKGVIPPDSTLIFEIELLKIEK